MYDLLAISYLLQPKAFKVEEACVEVVLDGNHRGQTIVVEGMKNCELALNVQSRDIENLFLSTMAIY